jgi:hypothetical protein
VKKSKFLLKTHKEMVLLAAIYRNIPNIGAYNRPKVDAERGCCMKRRLFLCLVTALLLLTGCRHYSSPSMAHTLVTRIIVTGQSEDGPIHRYYDSPEKMRQLLLYIRSVRRGFETQEDPASLEGCSVSITTICADNTQKVYRQKNDQFFQTETGLWQELDPEKGQALWTLLQQLPSDPQ